MKYIQFLEAKFTQHSLSQQSDAFSISKDGEQKATQTFMWLFRTSAKYFAMIKLPLHFLACKIGIASYPELAYHQVQAYTELKTKQAAETQQKRMEEIQALHPDSVISIDKSVDKELDAKA